MRLFWGVVIVVLAGTGYRVLAQSEDNVWTTPINITQSGTATQPQTVVDTGGTFHILGSDEVGGFVYISGDGSAWSEPLFLQVMPFSEPPLVSPSFQDFEGYYMPLLVAGNNDLVHGFWTNAEGALLYSRAAASEMASSAAWLRPRQLAASAVTPQATVGADGRIHLVYIRPQSTTGSPAGIYYRQSDDGGQSWTEAALLYRSNYLRSVPANQPSIKIVTAGEAQVYLVWENPLIDTVLFARSTDGGVSWSTPVEVDKRQETDLAAAAGPASITMAVHGNGLHLTWRASHEAENCALYHQWSDDQGQTWKSRQAVFEDARSCPQDNQLISSGGVLFSLFKVQEVTERGEILREEVNLQAWDGERWSEPESQASLVGFTNPETYRQVDFGCLQPTVSRDNHLFVIGCGVSAVTNDIWILERPLGDLEDWSDRFAATPVWSPPIPLTVSEFRLASPQLVVAADDRVHAFWSQLDVPVTNSLVGKPEATNAGTALYYVRLDAGRWSSPRSFLTSPIGKTDQPSVAADAQGNLFVVWSGGTSGDIYFSRAVAERAVSATEWIEPQLLSLPGSTGAGWPDIVIDEADTIHVAYTVMLNRGRGVYLTRSTDSGDTWTEPVLVFDGEAADWQMVGRPRLTLTSESELHLIWTRRTLPSGVGPTSLVYARSDDGGQTWSVPEVVVEDRVAWSDIVHIGKRVLHRVWLVSDQVRNELWHQQSLDGGLTWGAPNRVSDPSMRSGPATMLVGADGKLHILQLGLKGSAQLVLVEWVWDGERWQTAEGLELSEEAIDANLVAAVMAPGGNLGVIYDSLIQDEESEQLQQNLSYTNRSMRLSGATPTPLPTLTPTPEPSPTNTPTPGVTPTPTPTFSRDVDQGASLELGPLNTNNNVTRLVISLLPVALIVLGVFIIGVRAVRTK